MRLPTSSLGQAERTTTVFRLLTVALVACAAALRPESAELGLFALGAAYLALAGALLLLAPRVPPAILAYPAVFVDVGAVTAAIALTAGIPVPMWPLYLFPLAGAAASGWAPAVLAASLSVGGHIATTWLATGAVSLTALWPVALLAAATFPVTVLASRWASERHEKRTWQEIAAAMRPVRGRGEPDAVAQAVAARARQLLRAETVWLWWCDGGRVRRGANAGREAERPLPFATLSSGLAQRLDGGPIPLAELGDSFANLAGAVVALRHDQTPLALLAASWSRSSKGSDTRREVLRLFAPWAADALGRAQARALAREEHRLETILRQAAADLAATLDAQVGEQVAVEAARAALGAAVAIVEPESGQTLRGDVEVSKALVRLSVESQHSGADRNEDSSGEQRAGAPLIAKIGEDRALIAWRAEPPITESDARWLEQLATVFRGGLSRCAAHDRVQSAERRLREGIEATPGPWALWDTSGNLLLANAAYRALGLAVAPPGEAASSGVHEEEIATDNPPRVFVATTTPVLEGQYLVSLYREITREREALRAKDELIAMVGHELRTPLTSIYGYSQMMAHQLGIVQRQVDQLNRLIGDFVDAACLEHSQLPLSRQPVDLTEAAGAAAERFRGSHEGRALRIELADVPPVEGDSARLGQVIDNLLSNAAKYSPPDQDIVLAVTAQDGQVTLSVQDRGIGIAPEHLPNLFKRFYRVPSAERGRATGLGLGLSIVRDLVTAHGGRAWVESAGLGHGSTFRVSLPAATPDGKAR